MTYIHQLPDWPGFHWNHEMLAPKLAAVRHRQGRVIGRMEALGFNLRNEAVLETLTLGVLKSSEIEGELLNRQQVRSSLARRLGIDIAGAVAADRHVEGVVEMMLDATQNFDEPKFCSGTLLRPSNARNLHEKIEKSSLIVRVSTPS